MPGAAKPPPNWPPPKKIEAMILGQASQP